ncbi:anti-sigma factor antagonist [Streptomyces sp. NPDC019531]|uniref:anti-sigma factor antagonist n=1 Tax=Streptomyces sp. NPDC019531 TaxID=3365062 RepID=UPI00384CE2C8
MTIDWRYTVEENLGILSVAGYLGPEAVHRFSGAVGWALARGTGPVIVHLSELRGWSAEGQLAITEAARRLADAGRSLELAAIPADGSLVPAGDGPDIPVHSDLAAALAAHSMGRGEQAEGPP